MRTSLLASAWLPLAFAAPAWAQDMPPVAGRTVGHEASVLLRPGLTDGMANDYRVHVRLADRGTLAYAPGVFTQSIHFGGDFGFTAATATAQRVTWPPSAVLDGASGEWAWGKSMFLVSGAGANTPAAFHTSGTLAGFRVQGVGLKEHPSGGAGGAYADAGASLFVRDCDFEGNTNGISALDSADLVDVRDSAFSLTEGNGAADGRSHDAYVAARRNLFTRVVVGGLSTGNDIKIRAPYGRIDQSFLVASAGRWLDAPWGGDMAVSNSVLVQRPHAESDNMFGYAEEGTNFLDPANPASRRIAYVNDLIVVTKFGTAVFVDAGEVAFVNCRWLFVQTDATPPSLKIYASGGKPGRVVGLPFPTDAQGNVRIPDSAIVHDAGAIPPTPADPHDLPRLLATLLPGPVVPMP